MFTLEESVLLSRLLRFLGWLLMTIGVAALAWLASRYLN